MNKSKITDKQKREFAQYYHQTNNMAKARDLAGITPGVHLASLRDDPVVHDMLEIYQIQETDLACSDKLDRAHNMGLDGAMTVMAHATRIFIRDATKKSIKIDDDGNEVEVDEGVFNKEAAQGLQKSADYVAKLKGEFKGGGGSGGGEDENAKPYNFILTINNSLVELRNNPITAEAFKNLDMIGVEDADFETTDGEEADDENESGDTEED